MQNDEKKWNAELYIEIIFRMSSFEMMSTVYLSEITSFFNATTSLVQSTVPKWFVDIKWDDSSMRVSSEMIEKKNVSPFHFYFSRGGVQEWQFIDYFVYI